MSPSTKSSRDIKINVPRHNSQRIGPVLTSHIESLARTQHVRVDIRQTADEPTSPLAQAVENASDWNSLLMTARAERGPQWDVGTQLFAVDEYSELYYDPSLLLEYQKESREDGDEPSSSSDNKQSSDLPSSPQIRRTPSHGSPHTSQMQSQHPGQFHGAPPLTSPRHPYANHGMGFANMGSVPPAQFYGAGGGHDGLSVSPMRMGMNMGGANMGMNLPPGMDPLSPDVRRRVTRGMSADEFGGMH
ncbi:hypothetical protein BKA93DRAFT_926438 [Sparassis latifolia]|uniref:Uncharacterized protein n=1 Tax=Sparassis crispa TaxID=139825 RepID=A0A401H1T1_9APHY|nr:hypothetical protein SCP_1301830 [Sparassis crispa]GBE88368.1 hypothetical protein SCP_1301830 [Sparassis crispa]